MFPVGFEGTAPRCTGNILFVWNICILINPLWLQTRVWSLSGTHFHHVNLNLLSSFNNYLQNLQKFLPSSPPPPQTPLPLPRLEQDGERRWAKCLSCGLLEQGTATHSSILAWRIPWTEEPSGLQSMGSQRVGHDWATNTHTHTHQHYGSGHISVDFWIESILTTGKKGFQNNQTRKEESWDISQTPGLGSSWRLWRCPYEPPMPHRWPPVFTPPHIHALCHVTVLSLALMDILDFNPCLLLGLVALSISTHRMKCGIFEPSSLALLESLWEKPPSVSLLAQGECDTRGTEIGQETEECSRGRGRVWTCGWLLLCTTEVNTVM